MLSLEDIKLITETVKGSKTILEIGSRTGFSSVLLGQIAKKNCGKLYCVECEPLSEWFETMKKNGLDEYYEMLKTFSPWVDYTRLPNLIDYLLVDGDHRTSHTIADLHFFSPLVKCGGYIAIHDTNFKEENIKFMVNRAIKIFLEDHPNFKLFKECKGRFGTKVLVKKEEKLF
jgi:predicted O-methyltransferase YrrM